MVEHTNDTLPAFLKITISWIVWTMGAVNITTILTVISTLLVITYTTLQIYKLWRDIQKDRRIEELANKMASNTMPAPLGKQ